jgi:hypothetical protein
MKTFMHSLLTTTALSAALMAAPAFADVDENGMGFIGKGDVQLAFDWNNAELQAHADDLLFSLGGGTRTDWNCIFTNPAGIVVTIPRYNVSAGGLLDVEARRSPVGQVTGFFAFGFAEGSADDEGHPLGSCPGIGRVVDQDSIVVTGGAGASLSVSADGGDSWRSL